MTKKRYIVGSNPGTDMDGVRYTPVYYIDTRSTGDQYDGWNDIFTSTNHHDKATRYNTYDEAQRWNIEFLDGEGVVYRA